MKIWLVSLLLVTCGCVAGGRAYLEIADQIASVPDGNARIVILRPRESMLYIARKATISLNGEKIGATPYGGFHYHDIVAGKHRLKAGMWDMPGRCEITLDASAGQVYYFQVDPRNESFWAFSAGDFAASALDAGVISVLGGLTAGAAESYGNDCGGAFRLYPIDSSTAVSKLPDLKQSD